MTRILAPLVALALAGASTAAVELEQQTRRVYFNAFDRNGAVVIDLTAPEVTVKEGGKNREVASLRPATEPLQIAILVDDNGTGLFRVAVARFIEGLLGRAEFSVITVNGQPQKLTPFTGNSDVLREAINRIIARPGSPDGGQLLSGIHESALDFERRKVERPVILALTVGGEEHTPLPPHHVLDQLRKSGAALHVVSVLGSTQRTTAPANRASDLLNENLGLNEILGDGPKRSGGHREEIPAIAGALTGLQQLAEALKRQYVVEYTLPEGVKASDRFSIATRRKDVTLRAPTYIPEK